ncbi:hypothetical protein PU629_12445 [Pullulanibacillus sp. KACC 23026]|uniref:hypothetical protein n=1 Tax=Pullulanibacillus sp. KACC 23026 TaxID=3028315 RepID=UPI0023B0EE25|nr:hypothetical protein [Pullulanibacillus sp. KACC 23026]WEG10986.1 hypothetical protein PU629_12445 [Pullulanibacillus sp. KACC 23026]
MKVIHYDNHFNANEWFVISSLFVGIFVVLLLPKRFPNKTSMVFLLIGVFIGIVFDYTLSVLPVNYYDLNDSSKFEWTDFLTHGMYAAFAYIFFYLYDYLNIKPSFLLVYILVWSIISVGLEKISSLLGVFHYQNGYHIFFSFIIYLLVESSWIAFYYLIKAHGERKV